MVNWKKWFLEEDEEELFKEEEEKKVESPSKKKEKKVSEYSDDEFDIEYSSKEKEKSKYIVEEDDYDFEVEDVSGEFDIDFDEEEEDYNEEKSAKEVGVFSKIKDLFNSKKKVNKVSEPEEEEELFEEDFEDEEDEAEDYKTYLERQKRERQEKTSEVYDFEDEDEVRKEKGSGFFSKLKDKFFSVSDEEIEQEELDGSLDEYYEEDFEDEEDEYVVEETSKKHEKHEKREKYQKYQEPIEEDELVIEYQDDYFEEEYQDFEEIDLDEFEEKPEVKESTEAVAPDLASTLKKLGVENAEFKDVDIFGDKTGRRTHPTLAAVRTKRLKQDHKIDNLEKEVILGRDNTAIKEEVASVYREKQKEQEEVVERESKHKEERQKLDSEFNKLERKEDKIEKDNPLYKKNKELDSILDDIEQKENQTKIKEVPEFEVREVQSETERRERLNYTSVDDILGGKEDLFEDDIDRASKKYNFESHDDEEVVEEVEDFRKDVYKEDEPKEEKEKTTLDELIESENIEIDTDKDATTKEIEELNSNLDQIKKEKEKVTYIEEEEEEVDLVEEVAKIEDIEVEEYDEIKEPKKDRLDGYSDYHLDEGEIVELEEQNYLEETTDNVNIDSLLRDITSNKKEVHVTNDVDKFTEEKTVPYEVVEKRQEAARQKVEEAVDVKEEKEVEQVKQVQKVEEVKPVELVEEEDTQGIEYTEKLYTEDVYSYFDNEKGAALGEYKTIDRGYRPVSKEKIEQNQKILDAIFEKYSTTSASVPKKSVVNNMMETNTITPNTRSVGKFKPSPVYSSVYGSSNRTTPKKQETKKNNNIYKEIASQEEAVWNIGTSKRVPKNKVKNKKTRK